MIYSKKVSKDGVFTCVKNEPISQCENHEILSVTQEGKYNYHFITYKCKIHDETIKRAKGHVLSKGCVACVTEGLRKSREKLFLHHIKENTDEGDFELLRLYSNKITPEIVENVRFRYSNNITVRKLCDDYNISDRSVRNILWYNIYPEILSHLKPKIDGITANNSNKPPRRDSQLLPYKDDIFKLRDTQSLSYEKIGAKYGVSGSCVRTFYIRNS